LSPTQGEKKRTDDQGQKAHERFIKESLKGSIEASRKTHSEIIGQTGPEMGNERSPVDLRKKESGKREL